MSTQVVRHISRESDFILNFTETENTLSWIFTADGDGAIFDAELSNVASFKIDGISQTAPYNFATMCGNSYPVEIVKITNGQAATITLKTRRVENKSTTINAPDFALTGNGYLYTLLNNNTVTKRDPTLAISPNYAGSGVWNTTTLISTISLPTNTGLIKWYYIHYDADDIICWGRLANLTVASPAYICRIKPNGTVWDYNNTAIDTYTTVENVFTSNNRQYPYAIGVDYVNGYYGIVCYSISGGSLGVLFKKSDLSFTTTFLGNANSSRQVYFNPQKNYFPLYGDVISTSNRYVNFLYVNNITGASAYSINKSRTYKCNANTYLNLIAYNEYGNVLSSTSATGSSEGANGMPGNICINKRIDLVLSVSTNQASFAIWDLVNNTKFSRRITTFTETGLGSRYIAVNERSSQFFVTLLHASHLDKILVIDPNDANIEVGYIQESYPILCTCTNNYY